MIKTIVLMAMLAAEPALLPGIAAANQISQPMQVSFLHKPRPREAGHVPTALSPDEAKFLSLLRQNVASGGPRKDGIPAIDGPNTRLTFQQLEPLSWHPLTLPEAGK